MIPYTYFLFITLGLIWGINFLFLKWALDFITPTQSVFLRVIFGALPLVFIGCHRKILKLEHLKNWPHILVMALCANVFNFYFIAKGTKILGSGIAGGVSGIIPLCASFLAFCFLNEKINKEKIVGLFLGFTGIMMISGIWGFNMDKTNLIGIVYMLIASFIYSISFIWAKNFLSDNKIPKTALACYQTVFASIILVFMTDFTGIENILLDAKSLWAMAIGLGFVGTGVAYIIYYKIIEKLGVSAASSVTHIPPVVAIFVGIFALNENISVFQVIGILIILIGVFLNKSSFSFKTKLQSIE